MVTKVHLAHSSFFSLIRIQEHAIPNISHIVNECILKERDRIGELKVFVERSLAELNVREFGKDGFQKLRGKRS